MKLDERTEIICSYCKKNPGCKTGKPRLWNGFFDKETNQHVCYECRKEHYRIKSENGTKDFSMIEFPVQITTEYRQPEIKKNEQLSKKKLKVFRMNDFDWFADYSKEEAIQHYKEYYDATDDEIDDVHELTNEELDSEIIVFVDEEKLPNGEHPSCTFREHLEGFLIPEMFASTEY